MRADVGGKQTLRDRGRLCRGLRPSFAAPDSELARRCWHPQQRELQSTVGEPREDEMARTQDHCPKLNRCRAGMKGCNSTLTPISPNEVAECRDLAT